MRSFLGSMVRPSGRLSSPEFSSLNCLRRFFRSSRFFLVGRRPFAALLKGSESAVRLGRLLMMFSVFSVIK